MQYVFRTSPFMISIKVSHYNVTVGQDLNGDTQFNDRPPLAKVYRVLPVADRHLSLQRSTQPYVPLRFNFLTGTNQLLTSISDCPRLGLA